MAEDFKAKVLARTEQNESDITSHDERIVALEAKLGTPEQIALTLEAACADSKKLDKLFADIFVSMLKDEKTNPAVKEVIQEIINKSDRSVFFSTMKRWWKLIGGIGLFVGGYAFQLLVDVIKKQFGL